ncbi:MAG: hypothetical protein KDN19_04180 [Verrucomicrobiae bacterium]|nr:hypothetical protein [Verrucomicrobiae bacterium]
MAEKHSRDLARTNRGTWTTVAAVAVASIVASGIGSAQQTSGEAAAASGMTTGLPGVSAQRQAELMHVRARAQEARPEAQKAAMERSAEDALARKSEQQVLDEVRETKRMKEEAARQFQYQQAANAYQGVSSREISSWSDDSGRVKVERGVPLEVLAALPPEEEEEAVVEEEEGGFNPLKMPGRAVKKASRAATGAVGVTMGAAKKGVSWIPGLGKEDETETGITAKPRSQDPAAYETSSYVAEEESGGFMSRLPLVGKKHKSDEPAPTVETTEVTTEEKKGFFRGITSNLPLVGGGREESPVMIDQPAPAPAPVVVGTSDTGAPMTTNPAQTPMVGPSNSAVANTSSMEEESGGFFSKLPLVGAKKNEVDPALMAADNSSPDAIPAMEEEKHGIGSGLKSFVGKVVPGGGNSGGMAQGSGNIDTSLFPQDGDSDQMMADTSGGKHKLFKLPSLPDLPDISMPSATPETPKPDTPMPKKERSPVHSGGNAVYVVHSDGAQFMRFAGGPLGSEAQSLSAGTRVKMTKVGDEWSSVQLSNGSVGIIRNKDLKPASGDEATGNFAVQSPVTGGLATSGSGGARITAPVSATGAGISDVPGPPVSLPESALTGGASTSN